MACANGHRMEKDGGNIEANVAGGPTTDKKEKEKEGTNWFSVFMVVVTGIGLVNFVRKR